MLKNFKKNIKNFWRFLFKKKNIKPKSEYLTNLILEQINKFNKNNIDEFILVEIGTYKGESLEIFGNILHNKLKNKFKIISIDPYDAYYYKYEFRKKSDLISKDKNSEVIYKNFINKISLTKFYNNHQHLKITSDEAFKYLKENQITIDFCFIDGDHTYNAFKKDFENFNTLLKREKNYNGIICGHDYDYSFKELVKFLNTNEKKLSSHLCNSLNIDHYDFNDKHGNKRCYHPGIVKYFYETKKNIIKYEYSLWKCL